MIHGESSLILVSEIKTLMTNANNKDETTIVFMT